MQPTLESRTVENGTEEDKPIDFICSGCSSRNNRDSNAPKPLRPSRLLQRWTWTGLTHVVGLHSEQFFLGWVGSHSAQYFLGRVGLLKYVLHFYDLFYLLSGKYVRRSFSSRKIQCTLYGVIMLAASTVELHSI